MLQDPYERFVVYSAVLKPDFDPDSSQLPDDVKSKYMDFIEAVQELTSSHEHLPVDRRFAVKADERPTLATCRQVEDYFFERLPHQDLNAVREHYDFKIIRCEQMQRKAYAIENWHRLVEKTGCIRKKRGGTFAEPTSFSGDSSLEPGSLLKYVQKVFIEMCRKVREKLCCMEVPDTADANGRKRYTFQCIIRASIIERKRRLRSGDPWDAVFYNCVIVEPSGSLKLNIRRLSILGQPEVPTRALTYVQELPESPKPSSVTNVLPYIDDESRTDDDNKVSVEVEVHEQAPSEPQSTADGDQWKGNESLAPTVKLPQLIATPLAAETSKKPARSLTDEKLPPLMPMLRCYMISDDKMLSSGNTSSHMDLSVPALTDVTSPFPTSTHSERARGKSPEPSISELSLPDIALRGLSRTVEEPKPARPDNTLARRRLSMPKATPPIPVGVSFRKDQCRPPACSYGGASEAPPPAAPQRRATHIFEPPPLRRVDPNRKPAFAVGRVSYPLDGKTPLSRLFYLPTVPSGQNRQYNAQNIDMNTMALYLLN